MSKESLLVSQVAIVLFAGCQGDTQSYFDETCTLYSFSIKFLEAFHLLGKNEEAPGKWGVTGKEFSRVYR